MDPDTTVIEISVPLALLLSIRRVELLSKRVRRVGLYHNHVPLMPCEGFDGSCTDNFWNDPGQLQQTLTQKNRSATIR